MAAPVDEGGGSIDESLVVKANKSLIDGGRQRRIQSENTPIPVQRRAQTTKLVLDG